MDEAEKYIYHLTETAREQQASIRDLYQKYNSLNLSSAELKTSIQKDIEQIIKKNEEQGQAIYKLKSFCTGQQFKFADKLDDERRAKEKGIIGFLNRLPPSGVIILMCIITIVLGILILQDKLTINDLKKGVNYEQQN